jgi:SAM-dependent methyltransferase
MSEQPSKSHQESYRQNEAYAEFLSGWDAGFYAKYADTLRPATAGGKVLDVGCGVGQVVNRLQTAGFEAHGVDVSEPNIQRAITFSPRCQIYDGRKLPFPEGFFDSAGALNVLEHVEEPELFIPEVVRVVKRGGKIVLSSPNFFRVFGFRDYHPKMRGLAQKWSNFKRLQEKRRQMRETPNQVRFDRMQPIKREVFQPDDDAIIATNPLEMSFFLERAGCRVDSVSCTDRYVAAPVEFGLNLGPWRWVMFNAFLTATKVK